jgi:hypothetical protein
MLKRLAVASIIAALPIAAGVAIGGSNATMDQAKAAGWDCNPEVLIIGYYHCAPPGGTSVAELIAGTDVPSITLRVYQPDGSYAGTEMLRRADLYRGQPCVQDNLTTWDLLPFGYYACHHFDT